jgi:hypothetical protein
MMNSGGAVTSTKRAEEGPSLLQRVQFESCGPGQFLAPSQVILSALMPFFRFCAMAKWQAAVHAANGDIEWERGQNPLHFPSG